MSYHFIEHFKIAVTEADDDDSTVVVNPIDAIIEIGLTLAFAINLLNEMEKN